jgi:hypothetical protein
MRFLLTIVVLVSFVIFVGPYEAIGDKVAPTNTKACLCISGSESKIKKECIERITSEERLDGLWLEHKTGDTKYTGTTPKCDQIDVDFQHFMVIALVQPIRDNCGGFSAVSIEEDSNTITIRLDDHSFQSVTNAKEEEESKGSPWGMIILPKSAKEIVLMTNEQPIIGRRPMWKVWRTIAANNNKGRRPTK